MLASLGEGGARMYAIIETGGKQYTVEEGQTIRIEKLDVAVGETISFDKVLLVSGDDMKVGQPILEGASVKGIVEEQGKAKKIIVFKYKPKKGYRKKHGHRRPYTAVKIESING